MPIRIQRKRTKGYKMPEGAIYVGRPTKYGNPYDARRYGLELSLAMFKETANGCWNPGLIPEGTSHALWLKWLYDAHVKWTQRIRGSSIPAELRGHDLACWCALPKPGEPDLCHGAILLEIANK